MNLEQETPLQIFLICASIAQIRGNEVPGAYACGRYLDMPCDTYEDEVIKITISHSLACGEVVRKENENPVMVMMEDDLIRVHGEYNLLLNHIHEMASLIPPEKYEKHLSTYVYGNTDYYADLPKDSGFGTPVDIWENIGLGQHQVIARASDKFAAIKIIDALMTIPKMNNGN